MVKDVMGEEESFRDVLSDKLQSVLYVKERYCERIECFL